MSKLRLGPTIVRRQTVDDWLARFKDVPVRFLIAPPGFGKTVAILDYLRHGVTNGFYCSLPPESNPATVWNGIARALEVKKNFNHTKSFAAHSQHVLLSSSHSTARTCRMPMALQ